MNGLIRRQILENLNNVKRLMLSSEDVGLLKFLSSVEHITSAELSEEIEVSTPHASAKLKELYDKGYLMRKKFPDPTGGELFIYWFAINEKD